MSCFAGIYIIDASSKADNVLDAAKALRKRVNNSVGAYEIEFASGYNYVGKGGFDRALKSASDHANDYNDTILPFVGKHQVLREMHLWKNMHYKLEEA